MGALFFGGNFEHGRKRRTKKREELSCCFFSPFLFIFLGSLSLLSLLSLFSLFSPLSLLSLSLSLSSLSLSLSLSRMKFNFSHRAKGGVERRRRARSSRYGRDRRAEPPPRVKLRKVPLSSSSLLPAGDALSRRGADRQLQVPATDFLKRGERGESQFFCRGRGGGEPVDRGGGEATALTLPARGSSSRRASSLPGPLARSGTPRGRLATPAASR